MNKRKNNCVLHTLLGEFKSINNSAPSEFSWTIKIVTNLFDPYCGYCIVPICTLLWCVLRIFDVFTFGLRVFRLLSIGLTFVAKWARRRQRRRRRRHRSCRYLLQIMLSPSNSVANRCMLSSTPCWTRCQTSSSGSCDRAGTLHGRINGFNDLAC